jgi:hypothetical protein
VSIPEQSRPVIVGSKYFVSGGVPHEMSPYRTIMKLLQNLVYIFTSETSKKYPIIINMEEN